MPTDEYRCKCGHLLYNHNAAEPVRFSNKPGTCNIRVKHPELGKVLCKCKGYTGRVFGRKATK